MTYDGRGRELNTVQKLVAEPEIANIDGGIDLMVLKSLEL
jgi:hypothetical protein